MVARAPLYSKNFERVTGHEAWRQNIDLAIVAASKIESCLGPLGAYKMVSYNRGPERVLKVTRDAVQVLSELEVQYPAVKTVAEAARIHRDQTGDGVSTFIIILAGLLQEARQLAAKGIHPTVILSGYRDATREALATIDATSRESEDGESTVRTRLLASVDCGRGVLRGPLLAALSEAAERAQSQGGIDLKRIRILKQSGRAIEESELIRGIVLKKARAHLAMPERVDGARVLLISRKLDLRPAQSLMKGEGPFVIKLQSERGRDVGGFRLAERRLRNAIAEAVVASGADVLVCRSKIEQSVSDQLSRQGILAIEMVDEADFEALAEATGATIVGDVNDIRDGDLGFATKVEAVKFDGIDHVLVEAERGSTLLLRAASSQEVDESESLVKSAVLVMRRAHNDPRMVPGGGAMYMEISTRVRRLALSFPTKEQIAICAFADVMERIPEALARNYGLDRLTIMAELKSRHSSGSSTVGVARSGCLAMEEADVEELASCVKTTVQRANEVAALLLRIDDYFYVKELPLVHKK
jgi:chaperonin GroEL (HSP60 family)